MQTADIGGVQVSYRVDGPDGASALLLVNSLGTDHRMWDHQLDAVARDHRVIRYDARGQGGSEAPAPPYTLAQFGGDAIGLLDHLGIHRAHVCGVSLGGIVALWVAIHHSDRLLSATYANTAARIGTTEGWDERITAVGIEGMAGIRDLVLTRFFSDRFRENDPETVAAVGRSIEEHDASGYIGACAALRDADLQDLVGAIDVPSLVIAGSDDVSTPPDQARWLQERIPDSDYVQLEAGHLSNLERPGDFNRALLRHIRSHR